MKQRAVAIGIIAIVAACSSAQETGMGGPAPVPSDPGMTECPAAQLSYLVGQRIGEIDTQSLPQPHRVVPHGMAVTMEFRGERTTIWLDEQDRVERVICG
ncbi:MULTISPECIES: I78 family peptidase inhibitor [Hyphobacterium]|uniref:I78 family peptidase inhibitor n=1 Tax=Hyphobacterium vulgare TaxID=1736751 RepID=A0ABV7A131_9PROT